MKDSINEALLGRDMFGEVVKPDIKGILKNKYLIPPFSVLSARDGDWQNRKRQWISLGIQSELGRGEAVTWGNAPSGQGTGKNSDKSYTDNAKERTLGAIPPNERSILDRSGKYANRSLARSNGQDLMKGENPNFRQEADKRSNLNNAPLKPEWATGTGTTNMAPGTSIFDPVLCELMYSWFCPEGGQIIDPFAGGSVRGIVASIMGYRYWGCDLSRKQIEANQKQARQICPDEIIRWIPGDAKEQLTKAPDADFIFTCPPYGDLEVYSDDPADLSNMDYPQFIEAYKKNIKQACDKLKPNRFACFVVGDFRDKQGYYRCFPQHTIMAFLDAGLKLYNEIILVTAVGSLPIRITKQFEAGKKVGKTHQNVLVFKKP